MGDRIRFRVFAEMIAERFPDRSARIADVASGNGGMQSALRAAGYENVVSFDKRKRNAKGRPSFVYGHFDFMKADPDFDVVIGMHPDGGTEHIIKYALLNDRSFMVCPCCPIMANGHRFHGHYGEWMAHLNALSARSKLTTENIRLPMQGRNIVIVGTSRKSL